MLNLPLVSAMLGRQGSASVAPQVPQEIVVEEDPFSSKYKEGIFNGGLFRLGSTGGNILGTIGDALLIGSGNEAIYHPRLREARINEALEDYQNDPERAFKNLTQVDANLAREAYEDYQTNQADRAESAAKVRSEEEEFVANTHARALAYLGAATPQSYPMLKERIDQFYAERGVTPMFNLPSEYDEEAISAVVRGGISPTDRAKIDEQNRYHDAVIAQDRREEFGRNFREAYGEINQNRREEMKEDGRDRRAVIQAEGGISRPSIQVVTDPETGRRRVIRN